jgi:hypothetical protein
MSWSVSFLGKPENVAAALEKYMANVSDADQSKIEFLEAKPHLIGLVKQTFANDAALQACPLLKLDAQGSGYSRNGEQVSRSCTVKIELLYNGVV